MGQQIREMKVSRRISKRNEGELVREMKVGGRTNKRNEGEWENKRREMMLDRRT